MVPNLPKDVFFLPRLLKSVLHWGFTISNIGDRHAHATGPAILGFSSRKVGKPGHEPTMTGDGLYLFILPIHGGALGL